METERLLHGQASSYSSPIVKFVVMSLIFSIVSGAVLVTVAYSTTLHSLLLGSLNTGVFYASFFLSALLGGASATEHFGSHRVIIGSLCCLSLYMIIYTITAAPNLRNYSSLEWELSLACSTLGGISFGFAFSAQGVYFSKTAHLHEKERDLLAPEAENTFAATFTIIFFGLICVFFIAQSALIYVAGLSEMYTFLIFACLASLAAVASIRFIEDPELQTHVSPVLESPQGEGKHEEEVMSSSQSLSSWRSRLTMTLVILFMDRRGVGLAPISIAYGFSLVFFFNYVNDETVSDYLGSSAVGICGATSAATTMLLSMPASHLATRYGHSCVLAFSTLSYLVISVIFLVFYDKNIAQVKYIIPLFVAFGICVLSWQLTGKAIYARVFTISEQAPAFAALNAMASLSAMSFAFIIDWQIKSNTWSPYVGARPLAIGLLVPSLCIIPGYLMARSSSQVNT